VVVVVVVTAFGACARVCEKVMVNDVCVLKCSSRSYSSSSSVCSSNSMFYVP